MLLFGAKPTVNTVFVEFMPIVTAKCEGLFFLVLFGFNDVNVLRTGRNVLGACPPIADNDVGPLTAVDMVLKYSRNSCCCAPAAPHPRPSKGTTYQASNSSNPLGGGNGAHARNSPASETQRWSEIVDKNHR